MKLYLTYTSYLFILLIGAAGMNDAYAQNNPSDSNYERAGKGLFESDAVLQITLKGNVRDLLKDRSDNSINHPLQLSYLKEDSSEVNIPVEVKTRGHFRKQKGNCDYPPLLIQFPAANNSIGSLFSKQRKLKLVMPCRGDEYVVREWLVYKLYNLVTPLSFRARLVEVTLDDDNSKKQAKPFYGILLEEEKQMAERNGMVSIERKLQPEQTERLSFLEMAMFQYLVGNTDWSVQYLQNIKLLVVDSLSIPVTVPYDFDHAGIVNTPYARPAEELLMSSIQERRYRGYCVKDLKEFDPVIANFNRLKNDIYAVYTGCKLLNAKYLKSTLKFLDDFYKTINDPKSFQKDFSYPCDKNGTGNVIIKGMKEN
jgi:hypothetical protein